MTNDLLQQADWNYPTQIAVGAGRIQELSEHCLALGIRAPLLVTDPGLASLPMVTAIHAACIEAGLSIQCFSDIQANPTDDNVVAGVDAFHKGEHDGRIDPCGISMMRLTTGPAQKRMALRRSLRCRPPRVPARK